MTSLVPPSSSLKLWGEATERYHKALYGDAGKPAIDYLKSRAISGVNAQSFQIGIVSEPMEGHEQYQGRLAIPYLTRAGVVSIRFRSLDGSDPKYLGMSDVVSARLFNVRDLDRREDFICICEGEIDTMSAHQAGLPAVGVAGVANWKPYFRRALEGYDRIYVLADNDAPKVKEDCRKCPPEGCQGHSPGIEFAEKVAAQLGNAVIVVMPEIGQDVNAFLVEHGEEELKGLVLGD